MGLLTGCLSTSRTSLSILVHVFHLEDDLECGVEHFVQALLLLSRATDKALEGVLLGGVLDILIADTLSEAILISTPLQLLSQIQLSADENARTCTRCSFDLTYPLLAGVFERVALHKTEANDEAISVSVGYRPEATKVLMTSRIPYLKLDLASLIVLRAIVGVKDSGLVQRWERLLRPGHDNTSLADGGVANEHEFHVMLLVLIDERLGYYLYHSDIDDVIYC